MQPGEDWVLPYPVRQPWRLLQRLRQVPQRSVPLSRNRYKARLAVCVLAQERARLIQVYPRFLFSSQSPQRRGQRGARCAILRGQLDRPLRYAGS